MDWSAPRPAVSVLIADDNTFIREYMAAALRPHFTVAGLVANGRQLLEMALVRRPDVVVTDLNMPVLDGLGAMRALRESGTSIPVVIVSADNRAVNRCLEQGAAAFVSKLDLGADLVPAVFAALAGTTYVSRSARTSPVVPPLS